MPLCNYIVMLKTRLFAAFLLLQLSFAALFAQAEYYEPIDGVKGGATLKTALYNLIKEHKQISYGSGSSSTWQQHFETASSESPPGCCSIETGAQCSKRLPLQELRQ